MRGLVVRAGRRELMQLSLGDIPHRFNFMLSLAQADTERVLIEVLAERGIDVGWGTRLAFLAAGEAGFDCRLDRDGVTETVHPATVIGADGAHSVVRKSLGIGFGGESFPGQWGLADVNLADWPYPFDRPVITLGDRQICAFIPMQEGFGRFVSNYPDVPRRLPPDARVRDVVWQSTFHISFRQVSTYHSGNAFLAGDAAHIHSPVGARGMNLGIEDACWLAWLMSQGRTEEYTPSRWPAGRMVLEFSEQQTRQIVATGLWADVLRRYVGPLLVRMPPIRRRLLSRIAGLDTPRVPWLDG